MNPYHRLFDGYAELEGREHTAECADGLGVPWGAEPPSNYPTERQIRRGQIIRDPRAERARRRAESDVA